MAYSTVAHSEIFLNYLKKIQPQIPICLNLHKHALRKSLLFTSARTFRPLISLLFMLIPPNLGWLCPKGQVTRAQEAEENYLVKRELATVKQQSEEAGAELERAKTLIRQLQQQQQQHPNAVRRALASQELRSSRTGAWWQGWVHGPFVYWHLRLILSRCYSWKGFRIRSDASQFSPHLHPDFGFCHVSHWLWVISTFQNAWIHSGTHFTAQLSHHLQPGASSEMHPFMSLWWGWSSSHKASCSQKTPRLLASHS